MRAYDASRLLHGHRPDQTRTRRCAAHRPGRATALAASLPAGPVRSATPDRPASARALLRGAQERYANLQRYADTGCSRTRLGPGLCHELRFQSRLDGARDYRFEFTLPHPYPPLRHREQHFAIGQLAGQAFFTQRKPSGAEASQSPGSLRIAVAMATGISGGSAHTLSTLLFPDTGASLLGLLRRPRRRRPCIVNGALCHQIRGRHPHGGRIRLFIGVQDLLLRRLDDSRLHCTELRWPQPETRA